MEAMNQYDHEKLLSLSLAINHDHDHDHIIHRKRKRIFKSNNNNNNNSIILSYDDHHYGSFDESNIFRLLRMREQMLKLNHHHHHQGNSSTTASGLHLIHLLLTAAASVSSGRRAAAAETLTELYRGGASPSGDSIHRVAAYFADALAARLLTRRSPFFGAVSAPAGPTAAAEEFSAFVALYRASPLFQFAHFTANQAIAEALELNAPSSSLHVIDFDVSHGFQWPSLIQSLGADDRPASLRITAFGSSPSELRETEHRLGSFSRGFRSLSFEFRGLLLSNSNHIHIYKDSLKRRDDHETLAVNLVLHRNDSRSSNRNDMSERLKLVKSLNPNVVVLVEHELSSSSSFMARFVESLQYFAAMFDSLDDSFPAESSERLSIEKNYLGARIVEALAVDHEEEQREQEDTRALMESHGFRRVKMSSKAVIQAKLLVKMRSNNNSNDGVCGSTGFRVVERDEGMAMSLGWQDRYLLTASIWHIY